MEKISLFIEYEKEESEKGPKATNVKKL